MIKSNPFILFLVVGALACALLFMLYWCQCIYSRAFSQAALPEYTSVMILPRQRAGAQNARQLAQDLVYGKNIRTAYFASARDGYIMLGWLNDENGYTFPLASGRFFTQREIDEGAYVCAGDSGLLSLEQGSATLEGTEYTVVGTIPSIAVSPESIFARLELDLLRPTLLYPLIGPSGQGELSDKEGSNAFVCIPQTVYCEQGFETDAVLVVLERQAAFYLHSQSWRQRTERGAERYLGECDFHYGRQVLTIESILGYFASKYLSMFELIAQIMLILLTITGLFSYWLRSAAKQISVYAVCGMRKMKRRLLLVCEWTVLYLAACALSAGLLWSLWPLIRLTCLGAPMMPWPIFALAFLLWYIIEFLLCFRAINAAVHYSRVQRRGNI